MNYYLTRAGVKLIIEYKDMGGKFDKKTSPLTPQRHNMRGKTGPIEFVKNFMDIRRKIKASPKGSPVHYAKEGGVDSKLEKLTKLYARIKGRKFSAASLEHPDYDPDIKGNKGERLAARRHGKRAARKGTEYAFSGDPKKRDDKKAYAQSDHGAKEPTKYERVQRLRNRLRRRGMDTVIRGHQKKGRTVVGRLGAGHFEGEE